MSSLWISLLLLGLFQGAAAAEVLHEDGFESGDINLDRWTPRVYDVVNGATLVTASGGGPVGSGEYALRFKLEADDLDPAGKSRSELIVRSNPNEISYRAGYGVPHVYTFSIYLPLDWQPDGPEIVAQWHGKPDEDETGLDLEPLRSPPLALRMTYIEDSPGSGTGVPAWNIVVHWDDSQLSTEEPNSVSLVTILPPSDASSDLGQWVDWRFEVTWDWRPAGVGSVRVLKDDEQVALYSGPNAFNDDAGPNSRVGLYKWSWPTSSIDLRIAYYDDIRVERTAQAIPGLGATGSSVLIGLVLALGLAHLPTDPCPRSVAQHRIRF